MNQNSAFLAAFWAGLAAPALLYQPPEPYYLYLGASTVAQSFGTVAMYLDQASGIYLYVGQPSFRPATTADVIPVPATSTA
jgi:hypothetical protein